MGRRALVAYVRGDGRYDVHYAHWGAAEPTLACRLADPETDPVAADPIAVGVPFETILETHVDPPIHEALYVVEIDGVRAYRVLWLGPVGVEGGLLVAVDPRDPRDDVRVGAWFRGARAVASACRDRGSLPSEAAAALVTDRLGDWGGDREVIRFPAD